jgi:hypothetical protein
MEISLSTFPPGGLKGSPYSLQVNVLRGYIHPVD